MVESEARAADDIAGAMLRLDYLEAMRAAGFEQVEVVEESGFAMDCVTAGPQECGGSAPLSEDDVKCAAAAVRSARVRAAKPG